MIHVLVYFTSLSILQIFYVTGVSVSWSSPSTIYSPIRSQSVPTYNGNLQQESISSTKQPFRISKGTLTSQIDNLSAKMSSNVGLRQNENNILAKKVSQQGDNNDVRVLENMITNIDPSEISSESSLSSTNIPNFEIPVRINGPGLSNIYHETNKITEMNRLNEVNKLDESSGSDEGFQLGKFDRLSASISEDGLNLVDSPGELNYKNKKNLSKYYSGTIGENELQTMGTTLDNYIRGHKSRKINLVSGTGGSEEFGFEAGKGAKQGLIGENKTKDFGELSRDNEGRIFIENGDDKEGRDTGFSASVGSIQFGRENDDKAGGSSRGKGGDRGFSRSNPSIEFGRKNGGIAFGSDGEGGDTEFSKPNVSIRFGRKNGGIAFGKDEEEGGDNGISRSNGSIRFSKKYNSGTGGSGGSAEFSLEAEKGAKQGLIWEDKTKDFGELSRDGGSRIFIENGNDKEEGRDSGLSASVGSIAFGRKNYGRADGLGRGKGRERGFSRSNPTIEFGRKNGGIAFGSDGEGGDSGISRSNGSIRFSRKNNSGTGGSGGSTEFSFKAGKGAKQGLIWENKTKDFGELSRDGGSRIFIENGNDKKEGRDSGLSASVGSIEFGRKNYGRADGLGRGKGRERGFSRSNPTIEFGRKNGGIAFGSDGEGGDSGISRSNGSIRFNKKNISGAGGLSGKEEAGGIGVGRLSGYIRFGREGGSSGENMKISGGQRVHTTSIFRGLGKINGRGKKRTFRASVGSITFGEESGDKQQSNSNRININRSVGNYGGEGNGFSKEYGTDENSDGDEFRPEMSEKLKWAN